MRHYRVRALLRLVIVALLLGIIPPAAPKAQAAAPQPNRAQATALSVPSANAPTSNRNTATRAATLAASALPLSFVPNVGQTDTAVRFLVRNSGGTLFFGSDEAVLAIPLPDPTTPISNENDTDLPVARRVAGQAVARLRFDRTNPSPQLQAETPLPGVVNYLIGDDSSQWHINVPTYAGVVYNQLYDGIDLHYSGTEGQIKRTYTLAPNADPSLIQWRYVGARDLHLDSTTGDLVMTLPAPTTGLSETTLIERAPRAWQDISGVRVPVSVTYQVAVNGSASFNLGAYDHSQPLTIDPVLSYSTFLGGSGKEDSRAIALDGSGNIVLAGEAASSNFPTVNALDNSFGGGTCSGSACYDAVVVELNASGSAIGYSTFLGDNGEDRAYGVGVDSAGNIYATGVITGGLTILNGYATTPAGASDAFLVKLNPSLSGSASLLYSTYLGGSADEEGNGLALDGSGNVYLTGRTYSSNFPTKNARQTSRAGNADAFVTKLNPSANGSASLLYSTVLGGSSYDRGGAIAVDASGIAYITGHTQSSNFPTVGAYQAANAGDRDVIVAKLNPALSGTGSLLYSTYLGTTGDDRGFGIALSGSSVTLTGYTNSSAFPIANATQPTFGGGTCGTSPCPDAFVTQLDLTSSPPSFSTFLGGNNDDQGYGVAVDAVGAIYVTGTTYSTGFPTTSGALAPVYRGGTKDGFVTKIALPAITIDDVSVPEGNDGTTTAVFKMHLSVASPQDVTVNYATADGTATAGSDYVSSSGTVTFAAGTITQTITITVSGDLAYEPDETFVVNLSAPTNATLADSQGQGTITNDDPAPDTQAPTAPANLRTIDVTDTTVSLAWDAATDNVGVTSYIIFNGTTQAGTTAGTTFSVGGLTPQTSYTFTVKARDAAENISPASNAVTITTTAADGLPPDPATIAPPTDQTVATDLASATTFLYTGADPIQTGVVTGTIEITRAAVLRGRVLTRDGAPLPGVTISILDHPEYGQTLSRTDGMFDLAVNGGGLLTVNYTRDGYLPAQRQVTAPWRDYAWLPDVALMPVDSSVATMTLDGTSSMQVAVSSVVSDTDGTRQSVLLFPENVTGTMVLADGTEQPLTSLHVRATEYTVGENGPEAMPGALPANSGYTYAIEFSVDEALQAGATDVRFSQPIIHYVENFIGFPVGGIVPTGYYDREKAAWIPSENGRIIKIVSVSGGLADLDITGDGAADDASGLGVTDAERQQLAGRYTIGQELWRVPIPHFTPWDCNWPYGPPNDAIGPNGDSPSGDTRLDDPCIRDGSIVECQNQTLGETVEVTGTPFHLYYGSDRVSGRTAARLLQIPLTGASVPASLKRVELEITIAGRRFAQTFLPAPNQTYTFSWDGLDAYGRDVQGQQPVAVRIGYVYPATYLGPENVVQSFARFGSGTPISGSRASAEVTLWKDWTSTIGSADEFDAHGQGFGGWSLNVHHIYDISGKILYFGDGARRSATALGDIITTIAGSGTSGSNGDDGPAKQAQLYSPADVAVGPDGSVYIADTSNNRIRRIGSDDRITTIAGTGQNGYSGDGGPATQATLWDPTGIALGPDGSLYIADHTNSRIRRIGPNSIITTVAGDGGGLRYPSGVAVGPDGTLYIAGNYTNRVYRVGPDGTLSTVAGTSPSGWYSGGYSGDGGPASAAQVNRPWGVAVGPDGSLYIADTWNHRIRRVAPNGIITTVAGTGQNGYSGDGGPATQAKLSYPARIAVGRDGTLYIASNNRIRAVGSDGIIVTLAGTGTTGYSGDDGPAIQANLNGPYGIALRSDGKMVFADRYNHRIRQLASLLPDRSVSDIVIAGEDGSQLYIFDNSGRHLRTLDALTGVTIYTFAYDSSGRLAQVADRDGQITTIERDASGNPTAIVSPYDQRTTLTLNSDGYLASITNPATETTQFEYTGDGLLTRLTTPRTGVHTFSYDEVGRLTRDTNPICGFTALARIDHTRGYTVTITNALSDTTIMGVDELPTGDQRRVSIGPNGATSIVLIKPDGSQTITRADGTITTVVQAPDPRWGMQAPIAKSVTIKGSDGQTFYTKTANRTVTLADPTDLLSLQTQTDTVTVNGRTTTTVFNAANRTITTTDPASKQTVVTLDAQGRPVQEQTTNLAPLQYDYDSQGRLRHVIQGTGATARTTTLAYNPQGYLASSTDPLSGTTSYTYDPVGRVLTQTLPTGHVLTFTYDADGNRESSIDPQGIGTTYEYDLHNRLTAMTRDPNGRVVRTEYSYDKADNLLTQVEDAGSGRLNVTTQYRYTPIGSGGQYARSRVIDPLNHVTSFTYTPAGQLSSSTDPLSHTTTLAYTLQGWPRTVTTPGNRTTTTTYNNDGQPLSVTDPRGVKTTYTYDSTGRLRTVTIGAQAVDGQPALNQTTTYDYDVNSRVIHVTDPRGKISTSRYDSFDRLVESSDPLSNTAILEYDALDRLTLRTVGSNVAGEAQQIAYTYDAAGRKLTERIDPNGLNLLTQYRYTRAGSSDTWNLQEVVDARTHSSFFSYNTLGLLASTTDADSKTWSYVYDNLGRLTSQVDPLNHSVSYGLDALGRTTSLTQDGRTERWNYNSDNTLASYTDFAGRVTSYGYDADQRQTGIDYPAGTADVSFAHDASDNVTSMTDGLGTTSYAYDAANRLRERTRGGRTVSYTYTATHQVAQIGYWGRGNVQYGYDDAGRLNSLTPWGASATNYSYRSTGLLASQARGNGVTTSYGYDTASRLTRLLHQQGTNTLQDLRYLLDANGNRTQLTDNDGVTTYGYDVLNRLANASYPAIAGGPAASTVPYTFDAAGNQLTAGGTSYSYDGSDRITNAGYSYDDNGNLLNDGTTTYTYDETNRLIQTVKGRVTTTYGYDGWGNLVRESVGGVTTDFVLDERGALPTILGEVRSDGTERLYAYGPEGFAAQQQVVGGIGQGVEHPLLDALGSVRHLTDSSGAVVLSRSYDAYGNIRHTTGSAVTRLGYTGELTGVADGTVYLRARHYSPTLGRFLQRD